MPEEPRRGLGARALREPTVHFALLAALLFGVSSLFGSRGEVIEIDRSLVDWRVLQAETLRGAPLTEEERQSIESGVIEEQVLVREALALGLDDDERIHDVLVQKMLHVLSGEVIQPTEAELAAHYASDPMRFAEPAVVTVEELILLTSDPLPAPLSVQLAEGIARSEIESDLPMTGTGLFEVPRADLSAIFDPATADAAFAAPLGRWVGPYRSARGQHWLRPIFRTEATARPLDVVRDAVRLDWIALREETLLAERVAEIRERYTVVFTGGLEGP